MFYLIYLIFLNILIIVLNVNSNLHRYRKNELIENRNLIATHGQNRRDSCIEDASAHSIIERSHTDKIPCHQLSDIRYCSYFIANNVK